MKRTKLFAITGLLMALKMNLNSQVLLPYSCEFDNQTQQAGWAEYKKGSTLYSHWEYVSNSAYSNPNCISHDFSPSAGITLTDNWFVSPAFSIPNGGKLDSIRYKFSGFSTPNAGDTVAIYLLNGSQDPNLATSKQLLFDFRNSEYLSDNTYRIKKGVTLPAMSGNSHLAIRYKNTDCSSNWLTVFFDNVAISGNSTVGLQESSWNKYTINIYPNPFNSYTTIQIDNNLQDADITVYNSSGQQVKHIKNHVGNKITLSREGLSEGLYFMRLTQNNRTIAIEKFVISDN